MTIQRTTEPTCRISVTPFVIKRSQAQSADAPKRVVLAIPGVLAYGHFQAAPIFEGLSEYGDVRAVSYHGTTWDDDVIAEGVATEIRGLLDAGCIVTIFGISLGGLVAVNALRKLDPDEFERSSSLNLMIVDSPCGFDTLVMPFRDRLVPFLTKGTYQRFNGKFGDFILKMMSRPPKRENIEVPADVNPKTYQREVIKRAKEGLSGHSWSMWGGQAAIMAATHVDLSGLKGIPVTYFACVSDKNDTIVQPLAVDRWMGAIPWIKRKDVDTAHAAFEEASGTWNMVLKMHAKELLSL